MLPEGDRAVRVNGAKQVVVCQVRDLKFRLGRLPAHASEELQQLVAKGLSVLGDIKEVKVPVDGRDRAGWHAGEFVVYHHPA